jgi:hypothetical protein
MTGTHDTVEMAVMGLDTSVIAPAILLATRRWPGWAALSWPAPVGLPVFLVIHAGITVWMSLTMPTVLEDLAFQAGLIVASFVFWLPVLGVVRGLTDAGTMIYLYLAMPTMDLAGVWVVLRGDSAGGLAMIVAMLPVGVAAVVSTWRWLAAEEAAGSSLFSPDPVGYARVGEGR